MAALQFDARTVTPDTGSGDALPAGWYNVMMDESEMKATAQKGDGSPAGAYLKCRYSVIDGQYAGRKIFANLNLRNANPVAQEIAYKQLSAICHAVNVLNMQDTQELHGKPLKIKVKVRKATDEYEASNDIGAYKNINDTSVGAPAAGGAAAGVPAGFGGPVGGAPAGFAPQPQQFAPQQQMQPQQQPQQFQQPQYQPAPQQAPQQQFQPQQAPQQQQAPQWTAPPAQQPWDGQQQQQQAPAQFQPPPQQQQQQPPQQMQQAPVQQQQQFAPQQQQQPQQNFGTAVPPWGAPQ